MQQITAAELSAMERLPRATFFNLLSGFKSPVLIGTRSAGGLENLALFSSIVHIGSDPPLLGFILRPTTVPRHTYENLKANGTFTINHVSEPMLEAAHQTAAKYPESVSEFSETGLSPWYPGQFPAPYVRESPLKMGLRFAEEHLVEANGTRLIVGRVEQIWLDAQVAPDGWFDPAEEDLIAVAGLETYFRSRFLKRLPYARPDRSN